MTSDLKDLPTNHQAAARRVAKVVGEIAQEPGRIEPLDASYFVPNLTLDQVVESAKNPRKHYDLQKLEELAESIRTGGLHEHVLVRPIAPLADGTPRFELASGHRRTRALRLLGWSSVPAVVREMDDRQFLEALTVTNGQREDVKPMEEADGYRAWMAETGESVKELALRIGKSESMIYGRLKLLELSVAVREALAYDLLSLEHATDLGKVDHEAQHDALRTLFNLDPKKLEAAAAPIADPTAETDTADDPYADVDDEMDGALETADGEELDHTLVSALSRDVSHSRRFALLAYKPSERPTTAELRNHLVEKVYVQLARAPFDITDATLVSAAGACGTCPKRSGASPSLFPELQGTDVCLDRACYHQKTLAHIDRVVEHERTAYPERQVVRLSVERKAPRGVLRPGMYKVIPEPTKAAARGVYIDGAARGRGCWVKVAEELLEKAVAGKAVKLPPTASASPSSGTRDYAAEERKRQAKQAAAQAGVDAATAAIFTQLERHPLSLDEALKAVGSVLAVRAGGLDRRAVARLTALVPTLASLKGREYEAELLAAMASAEPDLLQRIVFTIALDEGHACDWDGDVRDELLCLGGSVPGIDVAEIVEQTRKAHQAAEKANAKKQAAA